MTNTEIKEVIEILKKEGCNSKKQAIEYLEKRLEPVKLSEIMQTYLEIKETKNEGDDHNGKKKES